MHEGVITPSFVPFLNAKNITELRQAAIVFDPHLKNWIQQRQL